MLAVNFPVILRYWEEVALAPPCPAGIPPRPASARHLPAGRVQVPYECP